MEKYRYGIGKTISKHLKDSQFGYELEFSCSQHYSQQNVRKNVVKVPRSPFKN